MGNLFGIMQNFLLSFLLLLAPLTAQAQTDLIPLTSAAEPMASGPYEPTWESLCQYEVPEWFRDAKFGIWAHWGPQCVEGSGDWMARNMYQQGSSAYDYHVAHYGHPSEVGFKDIIPLWKAEHWQPDSLVAYYKRIGARYFFALGNHHDNMDLWDSKYQPWNSVRLGPQRDILAGWSQAARANGLPFGISFHADHAWMWYEPAQGSDSEGDKAGIPYDGTLTQAEGSGQWWEGLDPQDLYAQNHPRSENNNTGQTWEWQNGAYPPSSEFITKFYNRTLDAINRYNPDLIYFDATALPFYPVSEAGLHIAAHYYNRRAANPGVIFGKILTEEQREALVWDVERGAPNEIVDQPWQTCTCLGNWHYNSTFYEKGWYKSAATVVRLLVDVVSKNGNLLLSVPLRADGTFDEKEKRILGQIGAWMQVNGEAIYGTRPWEIFGEGPIASSTIAMKAQGFNEGSYANATSEEVRFTQTKDYLYATLLAWPDDGQALIRTLADGSTLYEDDIRSVELLGYGPVMFQRTGSGLIVTLPTQSLPNDIAPVLRIKRVKGN